MSTKRSNSQWHADFQSFLNSTPIEPPHSLNQAILKRVHSLLYPLVKLVFAKLFVLHAVGATFVILFCPQLGVGPIFGDHGIMHIFMRFGPFICAGFCGAIFLAVTAILATLFLTLEEFRLANRHRFLNVTLLASLSFSGLMLVGGEADHLSYAFWIAGAILAGTFSLKIGLFFRGRFRGFLTRALYK